MQLLAAYRQDPASGINNTALGKAYMLTGELDKAVTHFNRGIALGHYEVPQCIAHAVFPHGPGRQGAGDVPRDCGALPRQWWVALVEARADPGKCPP